MMSRRGSAARVMLAALAIAALSAAPACSGSSSTPASASSSAGSGGTGGSGGLGGAGGEGVPPLDPTLCVITPGGGEDPAIVAAAESQWSNAFVFPASGSIERDKAFPLTALIAGEPGLLADLAADATLSAIAADRDARLRGSNAKCQSDVACYGDALGFTDADVTTTAAALSARLSMSGMLASLVADMRASGRFSLHAEEDDSGLVQSAFVDLVAALRATFTAESASIGGDALKDVVAEVSADNPPVLAFFAPLLLVDLAALIADMRDEASRYEPLAEGENAKALAAIPGIDWKKYPFTVILVPGMGPSSTDVALDPQGQYRADLGAQRFAANVAPLIVLSGGHVHPDRTPYSEAIEMKKYLMTTYAIPESALLVDPHARHTTTNLRNASRLLYRYGIPTDRPLVVTSDIGQSLYIALWQGVFGTRCQNELGYMPWQALVPMSMYDTCMIPVAVSLFADGRDPLDP